MPLHQGVGLVNSRKPNAPDSDGDDDRTEMRGTYRDAKFSLFFGRNGSMLLGAISWAVFILSTVAAISLMIGILEKLGVFE